MIKNIIKYDLILFFVTLKDNGFNLYSAQYNNNKSKSLLSLILGRRHFKQL